MNNKVTKPFTSNDACTVLQDSGFNSRKTKKKGFKKLRPSVSITVGLFFSFLLFLFCVRHCKKKKINLEICIRGLQVEPAIEFQRQQVNDITQEQIPDSGMEKLTYNLSFPAVSWNLISHYS